MTPEQRRRQLVGIGLRKFVQRPVQELSLDEVALEAGVSRGLLFHYFPTKTDYHRAVVEAARRRVGRNVSPDPGAEGELAVRQVVERFLDQVARRRETYVALVLGQAPIARAAGDAGVEGVREHVTGLVVGASGLPDAARPVVHGWVAYLEDRALQWAAVDAGDRDRAHAALVDHCVRALDALLDAWLRSVPGTASDAKHLDAGGDLEGLRVRGVHSLVRDEDVDGVEGRVAEHGVSPELGVVGEQDGQLP